VHKPARIRQVPRTRTRTHAPTHTGTHARAQARSGDGASSVWKRGQETERECGQRSACARFLVLGGGSGFGAGIELPGRGACACPCAGVVQPPALSPIPTFPNEHARTHHRGATVRALVTVRVVTVLSCHSRRDFACVLFADAQLQLAHTDGGLFGSVTDGKEAWFGVDGYPAKVVRACERPSDGPARSSAAWFESRARPSRMRAQRRAGAHVCAHARAHAAGRRVT